jgi:hypothetical protein
MQVKMQVRHRGFNLLHDLDSTEEARLDAGLHKG